MAVHPSHFSPTRLPASPVHPHTSSPQALFREGHIRFKGIQANADYTKQTPAFVHRPAGTVTVGIGNTLPATELKLNM